MSNYNLIKLKEIILKYLKYSTNESFIIEIIKNYNEILVIDLIFTNCMARIVVDNPVFAPYKNFEFEVLSFKEDKRIYYFYDNEETTESDILNQLEKGINYCINYV